MTRYRVAGIGLAALTGVVALTTLTTVAAHEGPQPTTISTTASAGGPVGTVISDSATVNGNSPTGNVRFYLFGPANASCYFPAGWLFESGPIALVNGSASSAGFTTTATGTYEWVVDYGGDKHNTEARSGCGKEPVSIFTVTTPTPTPTPTPAPTPPPSAPPVPGTGAGL